MHIKTWLNKQATTISAKPLPSFVSSEEFEEWHKTRLAEFQHMLGIESYLQAERTPLHIRVTGTIEDESYRLDKLYYESLPGLFVTGHLYIPKGLQEPAPAILYVCGHHRDQKIHYQDHGRHFARLGFVTLVIDTVQFGEVQGHHHGTYARGWFDWVSKGYTPTAIEVWNAIRGLDLLSERDDVDEQRLGVTGHSGGGSISWWTMCADERVKVIATSSGTGHAASHIKDRTLDGHCDCNFPNNPYGWSLIEQYALAAPRPVLIVAPDRDEVFQIASVREVYDQLDTLYDNLGARDQLRLFAFSAPHMYTPESRKEVFAWFLHHLAGQDLSPDEVEDIDGVRLPAEPLLVYEGQPPADDRSLTVQDWFIPLAQHRLPDSQQQLTEQRERLVDRLRQESFAALPSHTGSNGIAVQRQSRDKSEHWYTDFTYDVDEYWQLRGSLRGAAPELPLLSTEEPTVSRPLLIHLRSHDDYKGGEAFKLFQSAPSTWLQARIDPRGTGDTSWGAELDWHIRRSSMLLGYTVAAQRVLDTLRGIEALRQLAGVDHERIVLAGSGEMAVVALYAALLDGKIAGLILDQPPATLNAPDNIQGRPQFKEIINLLRYTDVAHTAACLWPMKLAVVGELPATFASTKQVYDRVGGSLHVFPTAKDIQFSLFE